MNAASRGRQRGATLLVTLVMLLLVGLVAVSALGGSTRNLRVAGNMQVRGEAAAVAQELVERTISSGAFTRDPIAVAAEPAAIDVDGDGRPDYLARLDPAPACLRVRPVRMTELDPEVPGDVACMGSSTPMPGRDLGGPAGGGDSLCRETLWNVGASVSDDVTGAMVRVHQGIAVRIPVTDAMNACPAAP
ncbi:MAG TPA: hypothetical protein VEA81_07180 [Burkholderiaceae bacterium]|nr:hypothetical protein [Burkholderiaceae bacterium]